MRAVWRLGVHPARGGQARAEGACSEELCHRENAFAVWAVGSRPGRAWIECPWERAKVVVKPPGRHTHRRVPSFRTRAGVDTATSAGRCRSTFFLRRSALTALHLYNCMCVRIVGSASTPLQVDCATSCTIVCAFGLWGVHQPRRESDMRPTL